MKLEQQVCNLELAKRLKELGVKQESVFYWSKWKDKGEFTSPSYPDQVMLLEWKTSGLVDYISAFTVAELGELLPKGITHTVDEYPAMTWFLECDWIGGKARADYVSDGGGYRLLEWVKPNSYDTEADARAKMFIYLLENGLLKND